jgi:hypothetical protein
MDLECTVLICFALQLLKRYVKTRSLAPGQSYVATFTLATHDLAFYNREQQFVAEAGLFNIQARPPPGLCCTLVLGTDVVLFFPTAGGHADLLVHPHRQEPHLPRHLSGIVWAFRSEHTLRIGVQRHTIIVSAE